MIIIASATDSLLVLGRPGFALLPAGIRLLDVSISMNKVVYDLAPSIPGLHIVTTFRTQGGCTYACNANRKISIERAFVHVYVKISVVYC